MGTGIESYSKFNDSIYFHDDKNIYVNLFIASEVNWKEKGVKLEQITNYPEQQGTSLVIKTKKPVMFTVNLHVPYWSTTVKLLINGKEKKVTVKPGTFLAIKQTWKNNDKIELQLPMKLHVHHMNDDQDMVAFMYGPVVLAGITVPKQTGELFEVPAGQNFPVDDKTADYTYFLGDVTKLDDWIKPVQGQALTFTTSGQEKNITFVPFNKITDERYGVYWTVTKKDSPRHKKLLNRIKILQSRTT
jgi:hypothetical protein